MRTAIRLKKFNININSRVVNKVVLFALITLLVVPSYNTFKEQMGLRMKPYINKDTYLNMIETNKILERYESKTPLLVFYGKPGRIKIWRGYASITIGKHNAYYGKIEDAVKLLPPENLSYLSRDEMGVAKWAFYVPHYGASLNETGLDNSVIIILQYFYDSSIPAEYESVDGITMITP
jgi:hypothetical protein